MSARQPEQIHIRCDAGQLLAWRLAAKRAGLDLSAWARQQLDRSADGKTAGASDLRRAVEAIRRLLLYVTLHEQIHPEWNGNRVDDRTLAESVLEQLEVAVAKR